MEEYIKKNKKYLIDYDLSQDFDKIREHVNKSKRDEYRSKLKLKLKNKDYSDEEIDRMKLYEMEFLSDDSTDKCTKKELLRLFWDRKDSISKSPSSLKKYNKEQLFEEYKKYVSNKWGPLDRKKGDRREYLDDLYNFFKFTNS